MDDLAKCAGKELQFRRFPCLFESECSPNHRFDGAIREAGKHIIVNPCKNARGSVQDHGASNVSFAHHQISGLNLDGAAAAHDDDAPPVGYQWNVTAEVHICEELENDIDPRLVGAF